MRMQNHPEPEFYLSMIQKDAQFLFYVSYYYDLTCATLFWFLTTSVLFRCIVWTSEMFSRHFDITAVHFLYDFAQM